MSVWDKSLRPSLGGEGRRVESVEGYKAAIRRGEASGHFGVAWGAVCSGCEEQLELEDVCFVFLFSHAKAVLSAAVRLGVIGPYQAQALLASKETRADIKAALEVGRGLSVEEVGQAVPTLDLYQGRHELLYSRVFNS
jgi:urease accessory protein